MLIYIGASFNLPLQKGQLRVLGRFFDVQSLQHFGLVVTDRRDPRDGGRLVDAHLMALNSFELSQGFFWGQITVGQLQSLTHDAINNQRQETHKRMRSDSFWQSVVHRCDFYLGLEYPKASFNISQGFISLHNLRGTQVRMRSANTYCRGRAFVVAIEPKGRHS